MDNQLSRRYFIILCIVVWLVYHYILADYLGNDVRYSLDNALQSGFLLAYAVWALGVVAVNARVFYKQACDEAPLNMRGKEVLQYRLKQSFGIIQSVCRASLISPIQARYRSSDREVLLIRAICVFEIYILRPLVLLGALGIFICASIVLIPIWIFLMPGEDTVRNRRRKQENSGKAQVAFLAAGDSYRLSLLEALLAAFRDNDIAGWSVCGQSGIVSKPSFGVGVACCTIDAQKGRAGANTPSKATHQLRLYDMREIAMGNPCALDTFSDYGSLNAVVFVVDISTASHAGFARAFDSWYELMRSRYLQTLKRLKCAVIIADPNCDSADDSAPPNSGKPEAYRTYLKRRKLPDIAQKCSLFRSVRYFTTHSNTSKLKDSSGVAELSRWMLQHVTK